MTPMLLLHSMNVQSQNDVETFNNNNNNNNNGSIY